MILQTTKGGVSHHSLASPISYCHNVGIIPQSLRWWWLKQSSMIVAMTECSKQPHANKKDWLSAEKDWEGLNMIFGMPTLFISMREFSIWKVVCWKKIRKASRWFLRCLAYPVVTKTLSVTFITRYVSKLNWTLYIPEKKWGLNRRMSD